MAIDWCEKVNGVTIFPKLPVYLRTHFETFEHGQRVRDALKSMAGELEKLTAMEVETRDAAAVVTAAASSASSSSGTGEGGGGGMGGAPCPRSTNLSHPTKGTRSLSITWSRGCL